MALTLFWRCESETLDGTHDYSAGGTVASPTGTVSLDASAAKVGSNGIAAIATSDRYNFNTNPALICNRLVGSLGAWVRQTSSPTTGHAYIYARGSNFNDYVVLAAVTGGNLRLSIRNSETTNFDLSTDSAGMSLDTWYFAVCRWDQPNSMRRIEVYDESLSLLDSAEDLSTAFDAPLDISDSIRIGAINSSLVDLDNIFFADAYDEPIQDYANIASFTEYGAGGQAISRTFRMVGVAE